MDHIKRLDDQDLLQRNLDHPPLKDTVQIPSGGYTIIRFFANNPGIWLMHCHVEFHSEVPNLKNELKDALFFSRFLLIFYYKNLF